MIDTGHGLYISHVFLFGLSMMTSLVMKNMYTCCLYDTTTKKERKHANIMEYNC